MKPRRFASSRNPSPPGASGFTLIELLTVIAIIALLAGIIFPVFSAVRENARRAQCITNMKGVQQGLKQYELDNRNFPDFIFSPAIRSDGAGGCALDPATRNPIYAAPGDAVCSMRAAAGTGKLRGLYPEYVRDLQGFTCPNNTEGRNPDAADATAVAAVKRPEFDRTTQETRLVDRVFYKYSAYEVNPKISTTGPNAGKYAEPKTFVARYSRVWRPIAIDPADADDPNAPKTPADLAVYKRQLLFRNPGDDAYLSMCTYHVPGDKVIVLWLNGQAKTLDTRKIGKVATTGGAVQDFDMYRFGPLD